MGSVEVGETPCSNPFGSHATGGENRSQLCAPEPQAFSSLLFPDSGQSLSLSQQFQNMGPLVGILTDEILTSWHYSGNMIGFLRRETDFVIPQSTGIRYGSNARTPLTSPKMGGEFT